MELYTIFTPNQMVILDVAIVNVPYLLSIRREIRQTITQTTMIDIDISVCHQVLMFQMFDQLIFLNHQIKLR
jgi:hypothetical protein